MGTLNDTSFSRTHSNTHKYSMKSVYAGINVFILPIVGIVVTISPNFNLYRIVVFPAASKPTIRILISFLPNRLLNNFANVPPILLVLGHNLFACVLK